MISSILINFLVLWSLGVLTNKQKLRLDFWSRILKTLLCSAAFCYIVIILSYLLIPFFFDHAESNVAVVAATWLHGHSIYTTIDAPERYSLLYGPLPYIVTAGFEALGVGTILQAKLPGFLNCLFVVLGTFAVSRHKCLGIQQCLLIMGAVALALMGFSSYGYWNRPDSYLTAYVFAGLLVVEILGPISSAYLVYALIGTLVGLAINCKVHGVVYFLPVAIYYLETHRGKWSFPALLVAIICSAIAFAIPFCLPGVSLSAYLMWLQMAAKHGLAVDSFILNLTFISGFLIFLYAVGFPRLYRRTTLALLFSSLVIAIIAAKPGAGTHHFIPLIPVILWWAAMTYLQSESLSQKRTSIIVGAFIIVLAHAAYEDQRGDVTVMITQTPQRIREFDDLKRIAAENPGPLELGYNEKYDSSFYKPWLVQQGRGLLLDGAAVMDMSASGIEIPLSTIEILRSCSIPKMIFPAGKPPWQTVSWYDYKTPLFSDKMKSVFFSHYKLIEESEFYQLWECH